MFFHVFCVVYMFQNVSKKMKKMDNGCPTNPSFSRIFGIIFILTKPLRNSVILKTLVLY